MIWKVWICSLVRRVSRQNENMIPDTSLWNFCFDGWPVRLYADQTASDSGLHYFPQPFCQHLELLWYCISASGLESTLFSRQIYLDYVTYLSQKCKGHLTYLTIVGRESRPWSHWSYCTLSTNSFVYKWAILFVQTGYPNSLYKRVTFHTFVFFVYIMMITIITIKLGK